MHVNTLPFEKLVEGLHLFQMLLMFTNFVSFRDNTWCKKWVNLGPIFSVKVTYIPNQDWMGQRVYDERFLVSLANNLYFSWLDTNRIDISQSLHS